MFSKKSFMVMLVLLLFVLSACQAKSEIETTEEQQTEAAQETAESQETEVIYEMTTVTINDSAQINYAPIYFAQTEGYFEEFGIELEVLSFSSVTDAPPLLVTGDLDVYAGSITAGLINIFGQEPYVKAVADRGKMVQGECTAQAILVRKDLYDSGQVAGPADLAGLKIAARTSATMGFNLSTYLAQAGLTFDDVELVSMPLSAYIDALDNKAVDVVIAPEHTLSRVLMHGNAVILSRTEDVIGPYMSSILAFGPRLIHDDPELGARFMAAYLKGVQKYNEGKTEENLQAVAEKTGDDIELINTACWAPIASDGYINWSYVEPFVQWSYEVGDLESTITEEQFWDPSIREAALSLINN